MENIAKRRILDQQTPQLKELQRLAATATQTQSES